ncbi:hypothetical protein AB1Y20_008760 [Prymnesium parvum]|uniref:Prolyl 4-hydroxylase alpha subunit domain-containing protein n=1 Tax=Prymnesium parvum TaxID=97485 RepID=A0AB34IRE9_PRYPA
MAVALWAKPLLDVGPPPAPNRTLEANRRRLARLRTTILRDAASTTPWWLHADTIAEAARQLRTSDFFLLDGFQGADAAVQLRHEIEAAHTAGQLTRGRTGPTARAASLLRTDASAGFRLTAASSAPRAMRAFVRRTDALVASLRAALRRPHAAPLLRHAEWRAAELMVSCFAANRSRYVRHTDNVCRAGVGRRCNGRRLTVVGYLNDARDDPTDGALRLYFAGSPTSAPRVDIEPLQDRLVVFWSDERVPHEVLPTSFMRFAATMWYFDSLEASQSSASKRSGGFEVREARTVRKNVHTSAGVLPVDTLNSSFTLNK